MVRRVFLLLPRRSLVFTTVTDRLQHLHMKRIEQHFSSTTDTLWLSGPVWLDWNNFFGPDSQRQFPAKTPTSERKERRRRRPNVKINKERWIDGTVSEMWHKASGAGHCVCCWELRKVAVREYEPELSKGGHFESTYTGNEAHFIKIRARSAGLSKVCVKYHIPLHHSLSQSHVRMFTLPFCEATALQHLV